MAKFVNSIDSAGTLRDRDSLLFLLGEEREESLFITTEGTKVPVANMDT